MTDHDQATTEPEFTDFRRLVIQRLESLKMAGLDSIPANFKWRFEFCNSALEPHSTHQSVSAATGLGSAASDAVLGKSKSAQDNLISGVNDSKQGFQQHSKAQSARVTKTKTDISEEVVATAINESKTDFQVKHSVSPGMFGQSAYGDPLPIAQRQQTLDELALEVSTCQRCPELCSQRRKTVFGTGTPETRLVFIGEGPGAEEDRQGVPFVGAAGKLLDKILAACKLSREEIYILNTVKCRPPGNRNPTSAELSNCWGYADRQLETIQPEFVVCWGSVAARQVLDTTLSIGKLRRQFHSYRGSRVLVTYHPAYLLRTPSAKKYVWEDMKLLMSEMGVEL
ncbi:MAG: uracil-DNA glycosylase [Planctomycetota bacterium]